MNIPTVAPLICYLKVSDFGCSLQYVRWVCVVPLLCTDTADKANCLGIVNAVIQSSDTFRELQLHQQNKIDSDI